MKNPYLVYFTILFIMFCSCEKSDPRYSLHVRGDDGTLGLNVRSDSGPSRDGSKKDVTLQTVCVEYPASYDWQRDTAYGNVGCRIVVFTGQKRTLEIPAGPDRLISPDPDKHRMIGGHLYSDFSTPTETIIYKDGNEIFRYEGAEMICGLLVKDEIVHTLGMSRSGKGLTYRKDGVTMVSRPSASMVGDTGTFVGETGALYEDGDAVCFAYVDADGKLYVVRDGESECFDPGRNILRYLDARYVNGELFVVATTVAYRQRPMLFSPGKAVLLGHDDGWNTIRSARYCRIVPCGSGEEKVRMVEEHTLYYSGLTECNVWDEDGKALASGTGMAGFWCGGIGIGGISAGENGVISGVSFLSGSADGSFDSADSAETFVTGMAVRADTSCNAVQYALDDNAVQYTFDEPAKILSRSCALATDDGFFFAASPLKAEFSPFVWKNGRKLSLAVNGYPIGIYLMPTISTVPGM